MNADYTDHPRLEAFDEFSKWAVGLGILAVALAPLSLPILILTIIALLPLAVPLIAIGLVAAVIAAPVLLGRRLLRAAARDRGARPVHGRVTPKIG